MIASPFLGEFGWEVALWAPWLRYTKKHLNLSELTVVCKPGHSALYADFACVIEAKRLPEIGRVDCQNAWLKDGGLVDAQDVTAAELGKRIGKRNLLTPAEMKVTWDPVPRCERSACERLAKWKPRERMIAVHARDCDKKQPERNWPQGKWDELMEAFDCDHVIVIGSKRLSLLPAAGIRSDIRGCDVGGSVLALRNCEFIIGPSSGPLHLANHCGVPAVWWSGNAKDVPRYERTWNPFDCPNVQASSSWDPSVEEVLRAVEALRG